MSDSPTLYSKKMMQYFRHPKNVGSIENADGIGVAKNEGSVYIELYITVEDEMITDARFKTFGCGAAIAASSMAAELVVGQSLDAAFEITNDIIIEELDGLPAEKLHCSVLAEKAVKAAITDYRNRKG